MNTIVLQTPNPLINVFNSVIDGINQLAVNARELHKFLKIGRDFATWLKYRIDEYQFIANVDYISFSQNGEKPKGGRPTVEYHLTLDMAKELAMVENNEEGRKVRRYFIRCEHDLYKSDSEKRKILVAACTKLSAGNMPISDVYKLVGGQFGYDNVVDIPTPLLPEAIAFVYEAMLRNNSKIDKNRVNITALVSQACVARAWFLSIKEPLAMLNPKLTMEISTIMASTAYVAGMVNNSLGLGVEVEQILATDWLARHRTA